MDQVIVHQTSRGLWYLQKAFHPALGVAGIIYYISRDCQKHGVWMIDETGVSEDREARLGQHRNVPALVRRAALAEIKRQQDERDI